MIRPLAILLFAACSGASDDKRSGDAADTAFGADTDPADTAEPDTGDTADNGGEDDPDTGGTPDDTGTDGDTGDTATPGTGDTSDPDTGDTGSPDTGDTDTGGSDTGTDELETGDTGTPDDTGADSGGGREDTGDSGDDPTDTEVPPEDSGATFSPTVLAGRTYRFNLREGDLTEPPGIGGIFTAYVEDHLLVEVLSADDATLSVRWGWSNGLTDTQDTCAPTAEASAGFSAAPWFETEPVDASIWAVEEMAAEQAVLSGTFSDDGATVDDATFSALAQTASLAGLLGSRDPEAFCDLMASFGEACEPCADGANTCMRFTFENLTGVDISPLALTDVPRACR